MPRHPFLAGLLLVAGCGADVPEGARLTVTVAGDAAHDALDPDLADHLVAEATRPTLVARDGAGQTVAGLASSWRFVDDGRSLILRLAPRKWSDGKDLDSAAVVAAFRRAARAGEPAIVHAGLAAGADVAARRLPPRRLGVLAPIARVVELRLDTASPLLLGWLADPGLAVTRADGKATTRADGLATLAAYDVSGPRERRLLRRRTMVARPDARPAEIIVAATDDQGAAIAGFMRGQSDIVIGQGLAGLGDARATARPEALRIDPLWGVYGYRANSRTGILADPRIRLALALAVDREPLAQSLGLAAIVPVAGLLPPSLAVAPAPPPPSSPLPSPRSLASAVAERLAGDPAPPAPAAPAPAPPADYATWAARPTADRLTEAARLLATAGYPMGTPLRVTLLLPPGRDHARIAARVAADWARVGVLLAVTELAGAALDRAVARGDYELALTETALAVPDPAALLARFGCRLRRHCNPEADALIAAARAGPPALAPARLARAESVLMTGPPLIPLFTPIRWALVGRQVDGWTSNRAASHPLARLAIR